MAYTKQTLADCKQSLADRMTNGVLPQDSATLNYWTRLLNRGVAFCADKLRITKSTTLTTVNGTVELPDDFILINKVFNSDNVEQTQVDQDDLNKQVGQVFWISGNHSDGFYLNTPTDQTWTVEYAYRPANMVLDGDVCMIPDIEIPVSYAYAMKRKSESDPFEDADSALQECNTRIKEIISAYSINNNAINFDWE